MKKECWNCARYKAHRYGQGVCVLRDRVTAESATCDAWRRDGRNRMTGRDVLTLALIAAAVIAVHTIEFHLIGG